MQNRYDNFHVNLSKTKPNVLEINVKSFQAQLYDYLANIHNEFTFWSLNGILLSYTFRGF
jgi:hypothetical protein